MKTMTIGTFLVFLIVLAPSVLSQEKDYVWSQTRFCIGNCTPVVEVGGGPGPLPSIPKNITVEVPPKPEEAWYLGLTAYLASIGIDADMWWLILLAIIFLLFLWREEEEKKKRKKKWGNKK